MLPQVVQGRIDASQEPGREAAFFLQLLLKIFVVHPELPVLLFDPLLGLGFPQLLFRRGYHPLQLPVLRFRFLGPLLGLYDPESRRLELFHLLHRYALDGPCERLFGLDGIQAHPHLLCGL